MNKKLIALAVAGACVAPTAMAQTANPVTLYGRVYVTFESVEAGSSGGVAAVARRDRVNDQSSLLGVRGTEDLGGGLKAFFQLETGFPADQSSTTFATRNSGVGLQGGWGSFLMGRWDMPLKITSYSVDAFGDLTVAGITAVGHDRGNFDRRDANVLQYWSPNFAGFAFRLAMTSNENKTATLNPRDTGANITYTQGPVYAFVAYEEHKDASATISMEKGFNVGGYVNVGPVKLGALYEDYKKDANPSLRKKKSWLGSVVYTMAKHQFIYQYQQSKDGGLSAAGTAQPNCKSNTVAYKYLFSARTFVLGQYMRIVNEAAGTCNFGAGALAIAPGQDPTAVSIGLQHVF